MVGIIVKTLKFREENRISKHTDSKYSVENYIISKDVMTQSIMLEKINASEIPHQKWKSWIYFALKYKSSEHKFTGSQLYVLQEIKLVYKIRYTENPPTPQKINSYINWNQKKKIYKI